MEREMGLIQAIRAKIAEYNTISDEVEALRQQASEKQCKANAIHSDIEGLKRDLFKLLER